MLKRENYRKLVFPLILIIYSLLLVNQGVETTDTGYSFGNFMYFEAMDTSVKFPTFLAMQIGRMFTALPFGNTLLGMNIYTGLVKASIAVTVYFACSYYFKMKDVVVFFAELMALGYCWCPTMVLYNYVTYFMFTLGALLICVAVKNGKLYWYFFAGLCLGINVFARFPNLAEAGLIVAVWYDCYLAKKNWKDTLKVTGVCIGGYAVGIASGLLWIASKYGMKSYLLGISELFLMSDEVDSYSIGAMLKRLVIPYWANKRWLILAFVFILVGTLCYFVFGDQKNTLKRSVYICSHAVLLFGYKKWGLFDFTYYNYDSIERVGILFLMLAGMLALYMVFFGSERYFLRVYALLAGLVILISPLGSDTNLFPAINNLFFVTPFVFQCCYEWVLDLKKGNLVNKISLEPLRLTVLILICFAFFQGVIFGATFVYRDGINGEHRTEKITDIPALKNMYTQPEKAKALSDLNAYLLENDLKDEKVIPYHMVCGLVPYLELEPAISSIWPDSEIFIIAKFEKELEKISAQMEDVGKPLIILGGDELNKELPKDQMLQDFIQENEYELCYANHLYFLYH